MDNTSILAFKTMVFDYVSDRTKVKNHIIDIIKDSYIPPNIVEIMLTNLISYE